MNTTKNRAATIEDIATECRLTKMTVSRALTGKGVVASETRRRVLQTAERLNYEPNLHARSLSNGRSDFIVLFSVAVFPGVHLSTVEKIQQLLTARGYQVPLYGFGCHLMTGSDKQDGQASALRALRNQRPRAVVCHSTELQRESLRELDQYVRMGGVLVCYGHSVDLPIDQVVIDYEDIAYRSACHLLDLGHRDIGYFSTCIDLPGDHRLQGFCRALGDRGIAVRRDWVFDGPPFEPGGAWLAQRFLELAERPTGMVIVNDVVAGAFINEIGRAGLNVPADVSVVGHDDAPCAQIWRPRLSTVRHPVESVAGEVVELLLSRLDGATAEPRRHVAHGELVVRESSGAPRQRGNGDRRHRNAV